MPKRVIVIASGETERRALPHLLASLAVEDIHIAEVVTPPRTGPLDVNAAERLIRAAWYSRAEADRPDKFVVLVDTDAGNPDAVVQPFEEGLPARLVPGVTASLLIAYAQRHLEAWFFADDASLRGYLRRDTGNIDAAHPDEIQNPKLHLKHLLFPHLYTAVISEEIARQLDARRIAERSPSFANFMAAVRNGQA
jgi:hypothetical protein